MIKVKMIVNLASIFFILCLISHLSPALANNEIKTKYEESHVGFPDTVNYCGKIYVAYRVGKTHANDKGFVAISLAGTDFLEPKFEIKDPTYDIRNPYFVIDGKDLFVWVSVYQYQLDSGFYKSRLYKIAQSCENLLPANLLEENDFSVVYAPITLHTGSFSKFLSGKGWLVSPNAKLNNSYLFGDEEMALLIDKKSHRNFGLIRNKPEDGLPLEYVVFSGSWKLIARRPWCTGVANSQLVSPKIYKIDNKFLVLYTQRQRLAQNFQTKLIIKVFSSVDKMLDCQPDRIHEKNLGNNWDAGYPSVVKTSAGIRIFWYATKDALTRIYTAPFPFN